VAQHHLLLRLVDEVGDPVHVVAGELRTHESCFKTREMVLGAKPDDRPQPRGLFAGVQALEWGPLRRDAERRARIARQAGERIW
jgi:hypothetical protein